MILLLSYSHTGSPRKHETCRFLYKHMRTCEQTRPRLNIWIKTVRITLIFRIFVFIEGPFILIRVSVKSPQVVFQVSCFFGLPVFIQHLTFTIWNRNRMERTLNNNNGGICKHLEHQTPLGHSTLSYNKLAL